MTDLVRVAVNVPQVGEAISEATLVGWLVSVGDEIQKGQEIFEVDTEKAVVGIEAFVDGVMLEILVEADTPVQPGDRIAVIGVAPDAVPLDAEIVVEASSDHGRPAEADETRPVPSEKVRPAPTRSAGAAEMAKISPRARRLADELDLDVSRVAGSGPGGAVTEADVEAARTTAGTESPGASESHLDGVPVPELTKTRRAVAAVTTAAKRNVPHFYLDIAVDAGPIETHRTTRDDRPSITVYVIAAVARVVAANPGYNVSVRDGEVVTRERVSIGVAVDTPEGLQVPQLDGSFDVLADITTQLDEAIARAREGRMRSTDFGPRSLVVSNLGMFDIERFHAILNEPDPFIVSVGAIGDGVRVVDGELRPMRRMTLSVSADHRIHDGASAARFLGAVKHELEHGYRGGQP